MVLTLNMEFISLLRKDSLNLCIRASHSWKYKKKSCLSFDENPIFNIKPLNICLWNCHGLESCSILSLFFGKTNQKQYTTIIWINWITMQMHWKWFNLKSIETEILKFGQLWSNLNFREKNIQFKVCLSSNLLYQGFAKK